MLITRQSNTQMKNKLTLLSILRKRLSHLWKQKNSLSIAPADLSAVLPRNCNQLRLSALIECLCYDNLQALVISGKPSLRQLQDKWIELYSEFIDLSDDGDTKMMNKIMLYICTLKARLVKVATCINAMMALAGDWNRTQQNLKASAAYESYAARLRRLNFKYHFDPTKKDYYRNFVSIQTRCTEWEIQLEVKQSEYDAYVQKNQGQKVDETYFTESMVRLSEHYKYAIDPTAISATYYCKMKTDYANYVKQVNAINQKNGKSR